MHWSNNSDNKAVNKAPQSMLIDNRFDNVKDWNKIENDSSKNMTKTKEDEEERNKNNRKEIIINPKNHKYKNTDINTAIIPKR